MSASRVSRASLPVLRRQIPVLLTCVIATRMLAACVTSSSSVQDWPAQDAGSDVTCTDSKGRRFRVGEYAGMSCSGPCYCGSGGYLECPSVPCLEVCPVNGQVRRAGEVFPASDGCNVCTCRLDPKFEYPEYGVFCTTDRTCDEAGVDGGDAGHDDAAMGDARESG